MLIEFTNIDSYELEYKLFLSTLSILQPICQSLKVANCFQLAQTFSPEAILNDHVCKVQCAFAFRAFPQVAAAVDPNQLGFS